MPLLKNPRHEQVAQDIAQGKSDVAAYEAAGFKNGNKNATHFLKRHPKIRQRAAELLAEAEANRKHAVALAAESSGTSKGYVMSRLHELVERCMQNYPVLDQKGNQVYVEVTETVPAADGKPGEEKVVKLKPAYTFDARGAARGLHLLGLEHGMFAQRLKIERSPFDGLPAPILKTIYDYLAVARGRVIEHQGQNAGDFAATAARSLVDRSTST